MFRRNARASRIRHTSSKRGWRRGSLKLENLEPRRLLDAGLFDGLWVDDALAEGESTPAIVGGGGDGSSGSGTGQTGNFTILPDEPFFYVPPQEHLFNHVGFLTPPSSDTPLQITLDYLADHMDEFGIAAGTLDNHVVTDQYTSSHTGTTHLYLRQTYHGLEVVNANIAANITVHGQLLNVSGGFVSLPPGAMQHPSLTAADALEILAPQLNWTVDDKVRIMHAYGGVEKAQVLAPSGIAADAIPAKLHYVPLPQGGVQLAWNYQVRTTDGLHWLNISASAVNGDLLFLSDWVKQASYNVYELPVENPDDGSRAVVVDPADPVASPFGWHDGDGVAVADYTDTRGNNVFAQEDRDDDNGLITDGFRPDGGAGLNFDLPIDFNDEPKTYEGAAIANLFYLNNALHDIHFQYGFDEAAGNFQRTNYTGVGLGNDPVLADAQDASEFEFFGIPFPSFNNAYMATPPDGEQPNMAMFLWDETTPMRDGDLAGQIVVHEYGHGVSDRTVGGPSTVDALPYFTGSQSGGLAEGWSDFWALMLTQKTTDVKLDAYPVGNYVMGQAHDDLGMRNWPYSFDLSTNPLTYGRIADESWPDKANPLDWLDGLPGYEVHNAGEIWTSVLWDMNWILVDKYGFDADMYHGTGGNNLSLQLVMDSLKLMPYAPTYLDARDAILLSDLALTGGSNLFDIWDAFARRGMGFSADDGGGFDQLDVVEAFDVPLPSDIAGQLWNDLDQDGARDSNEPALAGWQVFLDLDGSGDLSASDFIAVTDADGGYRFEDLFPGPFTVGVDVSLGWITTYPDDGPITTIELESGVDQTNVDFGFWAIPGSANGLIWHDVEPDGVQAPDEEPLPGVAVFADVNLDGRVGLGEPQAVTDADGRYTIGGLAPGTYLIRQIVPPGMTQVYPVAFDGVYFIDVNPDEDIFGLDFGNHLGDDFGDAPAPYPTLLADDGPVHGIVQGFYLGQVDSNDVDDIDAEDDGQPNAFARGDDNTGTRDEDGVRFIDPLLAGTTATLEVTVTQETDLLALLQGWIDFNADGDWDDPGEQILSDETVVHGVNLFEIPIPAALVSGGKMARYRLGIEPGLSYTGPALAGEVEDHRHAVGILPGEDFATTAEDSGPIVIDVLANDSHERGLALELIGADSGDHGGTTSVTADQKVSYTPAPNFAGVETFTYTIRDSDGGIDQGLVTVTVTNVNDPPTAVDDDFSVVENSVGATLDVLANDFDIDNDYGVDPPDTFRVFSTTDGDQGGTTAPAADALSVVYSPASNFTGTETFTYTIVDDAGEQSTATVTVTVLENLPPTARDDAFEVDEDSSQNVLDVLANDDTEPDVDETLTVISVLPLGTFTGVVTIGVGGQDVIYTPAADFIGIERFEYTIDDGHGGTDTAEVSVQVLDVNDPPIAVDDEFTVEEDSVGNLFNVLQNDSDPDGAISPSGVTIVSPPLRGQATVNRVSGIITYTPNPDFFGTDTLGYTVTDNLGGVSNEATVTINVTDVPEPLEVGTIVNVAQMAGQQHSPVIAIDPTNPNNMTIIAAHEGGDGVMWAETTDGGNAWNTSVALAGGGNIPAVNGDYDITWDAFGNFWIAFADGQSNDVYWMHSTDRGANITGVVLQGNSPGSQFAVAVGPDDAAAPALGSSWMASIVDRGVNNNGLLVNGPGDVDTNISGGGLNPGTATRQFTRPDVAVGPAGQLIMSVLDTDTGGAAPRQLFFKVDNIYGTQITNQSTRQITAGENIVLPAQASVGVSGAGQLAYALGGTLAGRLYLAYMDVDAAGSNNTDIYVVYSDNDGVSWSSPVKVNDDNSPQSQFLPSIAVDPTTGAVAVAWYDARDAGSGNNTVHVYASVSTNGGQSFVPNVRVTQTASDESRTPNDFGSKLGLLYQNQVMYVTWTDNSNSTGDNPDNTAATDIYTTTIDTSKVVSGLVGGEGRAYFNWHNRHDVNDDGVVSPLDALLIINQLNRGGARQLALRPTAAQVANDGYVDVSGDDLLTPLDALLIINELNRQNAATTPTGDGTPTDVPDGAPFTNSFIAVTPAEGEYAQDAAANQAAGGTTITYYRDRALADFADARSAIADRNAVPLPAADDLLPSLIDDLGA